MSHTVTVLYFAVAFTAVGMDSEIVPIPPDGLKLSSLGEVLVFLHPGTALAEILRTSQWSVDAEMVENPEGVTLSGGEEVAVIPPVSGG